MAKREAVSLLRVARGALAFWDFGCKKLLAVCQVVE
jgi:hypothetical protein